MAIAATAVDFGGGADVRFERKGVAGVITLTRPDALNALTHQMVLAMSKALHAWAHDRAVALVVIKAEGRAFSAGGDLMAVYDHRADPPVAFFADEYRLNAQVEAFRKPYVALVDGIVMGGGVGVSFHGSHRVMTENAQFAMPEVGIGFFPDVGASHLLPDLADNFGLYLGLTGTRVKWGDALWCGLATHPAKAADLPALLEQLAAGQDVEAAMRSVFTMPRRETDQAVWKKIDDWFSAGSLEGIFRALKAATGDETAAGILATLKQKSPTSLAVAYRELTAGQTESMAACVKMEYRIVNRMLAGHDFYEGIRTAIVDKGATPQWRPARLEDVRKDDVDAYFAELPGGDLTL